MKKAILILLALSVIITAILMFTSFDLGENLPPILRALLIFYAISSALLCWIGAPAGWRFAQEECGFEILGTLLFAYFGLCLSLFIALFKLLPSSD